MALADAQAALTNLRSTSYYKAWMNDLATGKRTQTQWKSTYLYKAEQAILRTIADLQPVPTPTTTGRLKGLCTHLDWFAPSSMQAELKRYVDATGSQAIRQDFRWNEIEPSKGSFNFTKYDGIAAAAKALDQAVVACIAYEPSWSWTPDDYAYAAEQIANRYKGLCNLIAIEVWNEQNGGWTWNNGNADATRWASLFPPTYPKLKALGIEVWTGGFQPHGKYGYASGGNVCELNFLEQAYTKGLKGNFDALSAHPYSAWIAPQVPPNNDYASYSEYSGLSKVGQTNPSLRSIMVANGDSEKKIHATETGLDPVAISPDQQNKFLISVFNYWKTLPWGGHFFEYEAIDQADNYGLLDKNGNPRPAAATFKILAY